MADALDRDVRQACTGHTDLTVFYGVIALMEGGLLRDSKSAKAAQQIIRICKAESARLLDLHDEAVARIKDAAHG